MSNWVPVLATIIIISFCAQIFMGGYAMGNDDLYDNLFTDKNIPKEYTITAVYTIEKIWWGEDGNQTHAVYRVFAVTKDNLTSYYRDTEFSQYTFTEDVVGKKINLTGDKLYSEMEV